MNIGFDAKRAFFNRTGLGNYSRNLIMALAAYASDNRYQLFTPRPKSVHHFRNLPDTNNIDIISPEGKMPQGLWRAYGLTKLFDKYSTELYHGLSAELPFNIGLSRVKRVVTIHDLIFLRFPELYPAIDRFIYKKKTIHACRNADHIIAISQQTKRDLINFLSISPEKISVVYQNCDPQFTTPIAPEAIEAVRTKFNLPKDFILNVGTLEKRKNAAVIIEALAQLERKMPLVLVGKATDYLEQLHTLVKQHRLQRQVIFLHDVGYADLPALYRAASIFAYPSIFEGFGIPIIEALYAGLPVIAAGGSCLEEAGGPDSLYFNPQDAIQLAGYLQQLIDDKTMREVQSAAGYSFVQRFNARSFAADTLTIYEQVVDNLNPLN